MTEIEAERDMTRSEVAEYLREFADQLDRSGPGGRSDRPGPNIGADEEGAATGGAATDPGDGKVTLIVGNDSATINPPEDVRFEIEVESDSSLVGTGVEESVSFEVTWRAEQTEEHDEIEIK